MSAWQLFQQADALGKAVALLLLFMSVSSWAVLLWKARLLRRAVADVAAGLPAFWQSAALDDGVARLRALDRERVLVPLVLAVQGVQAQQTAAATLGGTAVLTQQLTRALRQALHGVLLRLRWGQVLLASVGATAPFVGLLGTVWGIFHALVAMSGQQQVAIGEVSGPVGEALVMTAAGLAVAIPAVLAYNVLGRQIARIEAELEGFARDLRDRFSA